MLKVYFTTKCNYYIAHIFSPFFIAFSSQCQYYDAASKTLLVFTFSFTYILHSLTYTHPSVHNLLKHELEALDKVLAAYTDEKVKQIKHYLQEKRSGDISREEVERSLRDSGLTSIANSLKENLEKCKYVIMHLANYLYIPK